MFTKNHLLLALFLVLTSSFLHAQVERGTLLVGGGIGVGYTAYDYEDENNLADNAFSTFLRPSALVMVGRRLAVGGSAGVDFVRLGESNFTVLNASPQIRYYLSDPQQRLLWFGEALFNWNRISLDGNGESRQFLQLGGGMNYFLNANAALEGTIHFLSGSFEDELSGSQLRLQFQLRSFAKPGVALGGLPLRRGNWLVADQLLQAGLALEGDPSLFSFSLQPRAGYFVSDRLVLGAGLAYTFSRRGSIEDNWSYQLLPFVRYYLPTQNRIAGFFNAEASLGRGRFNQDDSFIRNNLGAFTAGGGLNYFLSDFLAVEAALNYRFTQVNTENRPTTFPEVQVSEQGLNLRVGFQLFLNGGKEE